jgi:hypothetical protein
VDGAVHFAAQQEPLAWKNPVALAAVSTTKSALRRARINHLRILNNDGRTPEK